MAIHYTRSEALLNTWSHAAGILLGAVTGTLLLMMCAGSDNSWAGTGVVLYLAGMLASYIASTVYHAMPERYGRTKERLARPCRHLLAHSRQLLAADAHRPAAGRPVGLGTVCVYMVVRAGRHRYEFQAAQRAQQHRDDVLHRHGPQRACGIQAAY